MKFTTVFLALIGAVSVTAAPIPEAQAAPPAATPSGPTGQCYFGGLHCLGFPWKRQTESGPAPATIPEGQDDATAPAPSGPHALGGFFGGTNAGPFPWKREAEPEAQPQDEPAAPAATPSGPTGQCYFGGRHCLGFPWK